MINLIKQWFKSDLELAGQDVLDSLDLIEQFEGVL
jgi:hypothetical protein